MFHPKYFEPINSSAKNSAKKYVFLHIQLKDLALGFVWECVEKNSSILNM